ncbi:ester cyclase [Pseudonocardia pini]|uniref:ester cyclase n=1 Tax=Pseudonocardia pini TaxID=2758030 RepID=UPI0015F09F58|nr:ester cyclase [Pseudonocardia pini]
MTRGTVTTPEQNVALVRALCAAVETGENHRMGEFCANPFTWHYGYDPDRPTTFTPDEYGARHTNWLSHFGDDFQSTVLDAFGAGDRVAIRYVEGGTMVKPIWGHEPGTEPLLFTGLAIFRIEEGLIAEEWFQSDLRDRLQKLSR